MFKNSQESICMHGMNASLITACMYEMIVNNASHKVYMYTQPNHIEMKYKLVQFIMYTTQLSHVMK